MLLGEALSAPIFSLLDATILGVCLEAGIPPTLVTGFTPLMQVLEDTSTTANYGYTRVFGSIGWGVR